MTTETLEQDVGWEPSGHLSEVALSAAADGEDALLDAAMHAHLGACDACAVRLGYLAMRAADVAEALAHRPAAAQSYTNVYNAPHEPATAPAIAPRAAPARRKVPVLAIAAALVIAVLGAVPSLLGAPEKVAETWSVARKVAPSLVRLAPHAAERVWSGTSVPRIVIVWSLAAALVAMGFGIARRASKKMATDGGRR